MDYEKNIGSKPILKLRKDILSKANGHILEIGIGSGTNLMLYPKNVKEIVAVDCYVREIPQTELKVNLYPESVCNMHFEDATFDTVISTFSMCSIDYLDDALKEIYRVLKPGGQFLFLEHGKSQKKTCAFLQNAFNGLYNTLAYGCNINRDYTKPLKQYGFELNELVYEEAPIHPRFLTGYVYKGIAVKPIHSK